MKHGPWLGPIVLVLAGCALVERPIAVEAPANSSTDEPTETRGISVAPIDSASVAPGISSSYWDRIRAGGPLVIGVSRSFPPFALPAKPAAIAAGTARQPFVGFDADLAEHLGQTLGVPIRLVGVRSREVAPLLSSGEIDLALAGLTRTAQRAAQMNFSGPYLTVSQAALVERRLVDGSRGNDEERRRDTLDSYADLVDLPGLRIAAVGGTRPHRLALSNFPDARVIAYPSTDAASQALIDGDVSALVHDDPYIRVWPLFNRGVAGRFAALLEPVTEEPICIAIRKGDLEFLRFLDAYAEEVREDGTVERLYRRHFVDAVWRDTAQLGGGDQ